jgi:hypothetical protein
MDRYGIAVEQQSGAAHDQPVDSFGRQDGRTQHVAVLRRRSRNGRRYEQPLVLPQDGQAKQLPARCICTPHW